jgi:hypothetical protein
MTRGFWLDQRTGPLPKRKPPDSAAITHEMERNYRLDLERGPTFAAPAQQSTMRCCAVERRHELVPFQAIEMNWDQPGPLDLGRTSQRVSEPGCDRLGHSHPSHPAALAGYGRSFPK